MGNVSDWLKKHRVHIVVHIKKKLPSYTPSHVWWIYLLLVDEFSHSSTTTFKCLQGHHVTVSMQRTHLLTMQTSLLHAVGRRGPLLDSNATALDESECFLSDFHRFSESISGEKQLVMNLGSFLMDKVAIVDALDVECLFKAVFNLYVSSAAGIDEIVAEQNAANESYEALSPVVTHQMAALLHSEF